MKFDEKEKLKSKFILKIYLKGEFVVKEEMIKLDLILYIMSRDYKTCGNFLWYL